MCTVNKYEYYNNVFNNITICYMISNRTVL